MATPKDLPDFKTYQERDEYFLKHADYFTLIKKEGVGNYGRDECKTLAEAEALAKTKQTIGGGRFMIYAVIGEQSAFVKAVPELAGGTNAQTDQYPNSRIRPSRGSHTRR